MMPKVHTAAASSPKKAPALPCFALAVLLIATAAAPRAMAQACNAGTMSGTPEDARLCVEYVRAQGSTPCCQTGAANGCTTMSSEGTAAVDICGDPGTCTSCTEAADKLSLILQNCVTDVNGADKVAGFIVQFTNRPDFNTVKVSFQIRGVGGIL